MGKSREDGWLMVLWRSLTRRAFGTWCSTRQDSKKKGFEVWLRKENRGKYRYRGLSKRAGSDGI